MGVWFVGFMAAMLVFWAIPSWKAPSPWVLVTALQALMLATVWPMFLLLYLMERAADDKKKPPAD